MLRFQRLHEVGAVLLSLSVAAAMGCAAGADSTSSVHGALTGIGDGKAHNIQITPANATVLRGASASFQCLATDSRGVVVSSTPSWTISDPGVAAIGANGTVTGTRGGTTLASCMVDGTAGSASVTVIDSPVSFLEVTPGADALVIGSTAQLIGTPRDSTGAAIQGYPVQWTTADTGIATITSSGQVLARAEGTATVTATSGGQVSYAKIAVSKTPPVPVATVTVSISSATLNVGQTAHATATTTDASGNVLSGRAIVWSSGNPSVATVVGTSSNKANVVGRGAGTTTITVTSEGKTGTLTVIVGSAPVQTVTVQLASSKILPGQTTQATATLTDALGNVLTGRSVTWSSLDSTIATVSSTGIVTAVASGAVIIRATSEGQTGDASLTVGVDPVSTVSVTLGSASLAPGQTTQATAVARDVTGNVLNGRTIAWSSLSPSDASVSIAGVVTAVSAGSTTIRATVESTTGDAPVTVASTAPSTPTPPPSTPTPASVIVTFDSTQIATGHSVQAHAVAKDATGNTISGLTPSWTSKATGVATVSSGGLVSGVSAGTAGIQATISGITGQSSITVYTTTSTTRPDSVSLVLDAGSYASGSYAVEATTTLANVASVQFVVDGAPYRNETIAKYCLFGGDASCASGSLGAGAHTIQAKAMNSAGTLLGVSTVLNMVDGSTSAPTPASPTPTPTGVVDIANFEDGTLGSFYDFNPAMHAVSIVNDPLNAGHGKVAKIHYNVQTSGANQDDNEGIATGVNGIGLGSEFWFSGDFMIPAGSDMVNVQRKLVYWGWSRDTWGFQQPFQFDFKAFGTQFCTSNIPWNAADGVVSSSGDGQHYIDPAVAQLTAGVWHHLMIHMKINSSFAASDGIQEITYDGVMIYSDHTMQWTNPAWDPVANPPSTYQWVFWQIGQQADASLTTVEDRYWDNVMFSRSPLP